MERHHYPDITLLITHYNRSKSLERLLASFRALEISFGAIIVSDDGSKPEHQEYFKEIARSFDFQLVSSGRNRGLGNNINKGQDQVKTAYTLYVQEDFVPKPAFVKALADAFSIMNGRPDLDIARFYAYFKYPYLKPLRDGFSEMVFSVLKPGYRKFYLYSDHPHLRRSDFFAKFGRYPENVKPDVTEYKMMIRVLKRGAKALFYEDFKGLFDQANSASEPSMVKRNKWRDSQAFLVPAIRHLYRHVKFNLDYLREDTI